MTIGSGYVGRRALDVFSPEDIEEDKFALRARQIKAAVQAYELQLRAYYEPNAAIAARLEEESMTSEKLAQELCALADASLGGGGDE